MSQLILYIIIFIIFIAIRIVNSIKVPNNKRENTQKRETYNDEDDILRRLSESLNEVDDTYSQKAIIKEKKEVPKQDIVYNTYSENKYAKYNDYNYAITKANEKSINIEKDYKEDNYLNYKNNMAYNDCKRKELLKNLDIKNAIMYNAILEPKRLNYRLKRKK